jgi:hypothetical protein
MSRAGRIARATVALGAGSAILVLASTAADAQTLKREPAAGTLGCNQTVLVDDGTCPKGKIKQVTGGCNMIGPGSRKAGAVRSRQCVSR